MEAAFDDAPDFELDLPIWPLSKTVHRLVGALVEESGRDAPEYGFVAVEARHDCPENECMPSVSALAAGIGGEMVTGWRIWEVPGICACAEHHAVWRKLDGSIVDPNRYGDGLPHILFLIDPTATWAGEGHLARRSYWVTTADPRARKWVDRRMVEEACIEQTHYARIRKAIPYEYSPSGEPGGS